MVFQWKQVYLENKDKISGKRDVFICYVHLCLIRRGFVCMGLGDWKIEAAIASISLPAGWNNEAICKLRYRHGETNYLIHMGTEIDGNLSVYVFVPVLDKALTAIIKRRQIARTRGPLYRMIPHYKKIAKTLNEELLSKVLALTDQDHQSGNEII